MARGAILFTPHSHCSHGSPGHCAKHARNDRNHGFAFKLLPLSSKPSGELHAHGM